MTNWANSANFDVSAGKWLEACGFEVGRFIHVRPLNNPVVITLQDERPDEEPKT
ncbi:SymE family type I addiction module toxin [Chryseolinea serpens]|uniref:hypothetical protein n=1 Tax=Chryseolinea serpens TaxID=947013 RepID=UPI0015C0D359|nr:hypothetical protein [Chryseolinea serpens]